MKIRRCNCAILNIEMKTISRIAACLLAAVIVSGCAAEQGANTDRELLEYSNLSYDSGFDTVYAYTEFGYDRDAMQKRFETGTEMFAGYNSQFDIYNDYAGVSNLKTINDNAGIAPVKVSEDIIAMLKEARQFYDLSGGEFDITMGNLLQVWHRYREAGMAANEDGSGGAVPGEAELAEAFACRGWDKVVIDEENSTVFITDPCVSLDAGGIAKGFAAEGIALAIESDEVVYANINAGRNIRTIHDKADGSPWRIAIQNPVGEGALIVVETHGSGSFVTSGDYERFYTGRDGVRYHHIIDPSTMKPADLYHSVSIITRDSGAADCLSTALFTMDIEEGKKVLEAYRRMSNDECEAVWMMDPDKTQGQDGKLAGGLFVVWTENLNDRIIWP